MLWGAIGPPSGRWVSRPFSLSLSVFLPPPHSPFPISLIPKKKKGSHSPLSSLPEGDALRRSSSSWFLVAAKAAAKMEPMSVDSGGCSGLDAQIEQLMQCRPLAEQEVRSRSATTPFRTGFRLGGAYFVARSGVC